PNTILAAYGLGAQLGVLLPYSRTQESEADHIGLLLMARAGYDPRGALAFWQRMERAAGGAPPEFLSTHPSHGTREQQIQAWLPDAMRYYEASAHTGVEPLPATAAADTLAPEAPSGVARDWLRQHFLPALERAVSEASGAPATVLLLVNRELSIPARAGALPGHRAAYATNGAPSRYTFDNFVVGESNRVAYGAARAVVAQPGARFNPLFLCGGCGLGKTHLLSAVATGLAHARPLGTVVCLTAENFVNEMIAALAARRMDRFRRKFRGIQTLI